MALVNQSNAEENWLEVLDLWDRIANWVNYRISEAELRRQFKSMLVYLWNEKDWLKNQYPAKAKLIEQVIDASTYMGVVGDLANTVKHRSLTKHVRSAASQTNYYGTVTVAGGAERRMYYIGLESGKHAEIMAVLRGALDEFEELRFGLRSGAL